MSRKHKFSNGSFLIKSLETGASMFLNKHNHSLKRTGPCRISEKQFHCRRFFYFWETFQNSYFVEHAGLAACDIKYLHVATCTPASIGGTANWNWRSVSTDTLQNNLKLSIFQNSLVRFIQNSWHYIGFFENLPQQFDILHWLYLN